MSFYSITRSILPVMWPDGQEQPDTHARVMDPMTGRWVWVERAQVETWLKHRQRLAAKER